MSTDIDNREVVLYYRQKRIETILLKSYTHEIAGIMSHLVVKNCNGCMTNYHLSQTHHQCLMMESDGQLCLYFDCAFGKVSEGNVMEVFNQSLNNITPKVNGLELLKYTCHDWRSDFCTEQRRLLKQETFKLL